MASSANFTVNATVISNLTIVNNRNLNFGQFASNTGGTVVIQPTDAGTRSVTGTVMPVLAQPGSSARFAVTGEAGLTFAITLPADPTLTRDGGAETMGVTLTGGTTDGAGLTGRTLTGGVNTVYIGGTVTVASGQVAGVYKIGGAADTAITVNIAYE